MNEKRQYGTSCSSARSRKKEVKKVEPLRQKDAYIEDPMDWLDQYIRSRSRSQKLEIIQLRIIGICMVLICIAIVVLASTGSTAADRDVSPVVLIGMIAYRLLTAKKVPAPEDDEPYYDREENENG